MSCVEAVVVDTKEIGLTRSRFFIERLERFRPLCVQSEPWTGSSNSGAANARIVM